MNRKTLTLSLALALVALAAIPALAADKPPEPKSVTAVQTITATITAIDQAKRTVSLKGPKGNVVTIDVPEVVKRFNELKVGDEVTVKYTESLAVRIAKPGEMASASAAAGPKPGPRPGGEAKGEATLVVTLLDVDPTVPSVTFKTPDGEVRTIHVKDKKNMEGFKKGDQVAITYTEALAVDVSTPVKK